MITDNDEYEKKRLTGNSTAHQPVDNVIATAILKAGCLIGAICVLFLGGIVGLCFWLGPWLTLFGAQLLTAGICLVLMVLSHLANPGLLSSIIFEFQTGRWLRAIRTFIASILVIFANSWLWIGEAIAAIIAVRRAANSSSKTSNRLRKSMITNSVIIEVHLVAIAVAGALASAILPMPEQLAFWAAAITAAATTALFGAFALVPGSLEERLKRSTKYSFTNLFLFASLSYAALVICYSRLRGAMLTDDLGTFLSTAKNLALPGRNWLIQKVDASTNFVFDLSASFPVVNVAELTLLQGAEITSALLFSVSVVTIFVKREKLRRKPLDTMDFVDSLLKLGRFEQCREQLNAVDTGNRDFRWWLGMALTELARGEEKSRVYEYAKKAASEHYQRYSGVRQNAKALLYRLVVSFELPPETFIDSLIAWIESEDCTDMDLWSVVYSARTTTSGRHVLAILSSQIIWARFPFTRTLLWGIESSFEDARNGLELLRSRQSEPIFEQFLMEYYMKLIDTPDSVGEWLNNSIESIERSVESLRSEYRVRSASEWTFKMAFWYGSKSVKKKLKSTSRELHERYKQAPGLINPDVFRSIVIASTITESLARRWPRLRKFAHATNAE